MVELRTLCTGELRGSQLEAVRALLYAAFDGDFDDDDWKHSLGGQHVVGVLRGEIVAHGCVVPRMLTVGGRALRAGYVEAVATTPQWQRRGFGGRIMVELRSLIVATYELGALSTSEEGRGLYHRLGWCTWLGPSFVEAPDGRRPTPDDDGGIMVLLTDATADLDLTAPITCDWRAGDVW